MMKRMGSKCAVLLLASLPLSTAQAQELGDKEAEQLIERYVAIDARTREGLEEQDRILERLAAYPALDERGVKTWRKTIDKLAAKQPTLEKKSGKYFLWEKEERGLFLVGGETKRPKGLFIGMHGGGAGSGDAWSAHGALNGAVSGEDWVAIYPEVLEKTEHGWTDSGTEEFVLELVERALRTWRIDRDRVVFGGHSMGGYGTWTLGAHHADVVAALMPSAGAPTPVYGPGGLEGVQDGVVPNLRNVSMVIYQSDDDPQVTPDANRAAVKQMREAQERWGGYDFEYWEVSGRGHDLPPGGMKALVEKIADRRRNARPERVVWQPELRWKRQFYWLWAKQPPRGAVLVADLDRKTNSITVDGAGPGMFVLLGSELVDFEREVTVTAAGKEVFRGIPERSLAALVATGVHGDPARTYEAWVALVP